MVQRMYFNVRKTMLYFLYKLSINKVGCKARTFFIHKIHLNILL